MIRSQPWRYSGSDILGGWHTLSYWLILVFEKIETVNSKAFSLLIISEGMAKKLEYAREIIKDTFPMYYSNILKRYLLPSMHLKLSVSLIRHLRSHLNMERGSNALQLNF